MRFYRPLLEVRSGPVCQLDTSGAHSCLDCFRYVHIICGRNIGEEGFGSFILCNICDLKRNKIMLNQRGLN